MRKRGRKIARSRLATTLSLFFLLFDPGQGVLLLLHGIGG